MEDKTIVELLYVHNEKGLIETKKKYHNLLYELSYGIVRNREDSEECTNDTYLKIWKVIPPNKPTFFKAFICKITRQISIDKYRYNHSKNRKDNVAIEDLNYEICSKDLVESKVDEKILIDEINNFISNLDIESQVLFVRRYFFFEEVKNLSNKFDLSVNYINVKLFRIRNKLKKHLESEGYVIEKG